MLCLPVQSWYLSWQCPVVQWHLSVFITRLLSLIVIINRAWRSRSLSSAQLTPTCCCVFIPEGVFLHGGQMGQVLVHLKKKKWPFKLFWVLILPLSPFLPHDLEVACSSPINLSPLSDMRRNLKCVWFSRKWDSCAFTGQWCILFPVRFGLKEIFANKVLNELNVSQACSLIWALASMTDWTRHPHYYHELMCLTWSTHCSNFSHDTITDLFVHWLFLFVTLLSACVFL